MYVKHLSLQNFRSYGERTFDFCETTNVLFGGNAQGKTTALEAVYLFSIGKSFKTNQDRELIKFGCDFARTNIIFSDKSREQNIEIILRKDRKKQIKINGVLITKLSELIGIFKVVLFCPEELNLIKEGPHLRRRFMDIAICQLRPNYYHILGQYNRVLEQRNNLLRKLKFNNSLSDTIFIWDEKLAELAQRITSYRISFIDKINALAAKIHEEICGERLSVEYVAKFISKEDYLMRLSDSLDRDIEKGFTSLGPHRDDINIYIGKTDAKTFASQGQQRTAVLSLKLAEAELMADDCGEYPVLLLDDIMSELDVSRRSFLTQKIKDKQVIITSTDVDSARPDENARCIEIIKDCD